jgi:3-oxoacyl-[acyl-carrier-protein] synthase-3
MMSGIRQRRFWREGSVPSDGSTLAGRRALENAGARPGEIDCLLHTSVSRDFIEPATASVVHHRLGLSPRALFFDISNACLGFLNGMATMANMIELGQVRRGLIVAGESSRQLVRSTIDSLLSNRQLTRRQLKNAFASLTIGSGAVAMVMTHESVSRTGHRLPGGVVRTATEHNDLCRGSADTGFAGSADVTMHTEAETLLVHGCRLASETWSAFREDLGWRGSDIDRVFCHQVGETHRDRFYESIDIDPSKDFSTYPFLGNTGAAALPLSMAIAVEETPPTKGDKIALLGIGSGLSSVMLGIEW